MNKHVVKELKATGQMLNSVIQLSVSKIIGGMLGGFYAAKFGFHSAFVLLMVIAGVATIGFYAVSRFLPVYANVTRSSVEPHTVQQTR
ncbi:hypothetical protein LJK88_28295 [Paenibacillus sp. P26]|nr:hypothetical protein LJK88_28295 [Paenibacillus sp. P26]